MELEHKPVSGMRWNWSAAWRIASGALGGLVLILAATKIPWFGGSPIARDTMVRVEIVPPAGTMVDSLAISPAGDQIVFAAQDAGGARLWLRRIDETTATPLDGTVGASYPFWAPSSRQLGFFAGGKLKRLSLSTGNVYDVAPAPHGRGGTWSDRGDIIFAADDDSPLSHVPAAGGEVTPVTTLDPEFRESHKWPEFLPGGKRFLYTDYSADATRNGIYVADLETKGTTRLVEVCSSARYSRDGYLIYASNSLMAQSFDAARLRVIGAPMPVTDLLRQRDDQGVKSDFSVSYSGRIVVRSAGLAPFTMLVNWQQSLQK